MFSPAILLRHPLVVAIPLYIAFLSIGGRGGVRLWAFEPVALAASTVNEEPDTALNEEERLARALRRSQEEVATLAEANNLLRQAAHQLKDFAAFQDKRSENAIPARIILRGDSSNWRHSMYLNRGRRHGVSEGAIVTVGNTLAGRVIDCSPDVSLVQLVTDPGFVVPVSILASIPSVVGGGTATRNSAQPLCAPGATRGLLRGSASAILRLPRLAIEDIDLDCGVKAGMIVVTNDTGGQFPPGLLVGRVSDIHNRQAFLTVEVECALDLGILDIVLVIPHRRPTLDETARLFAPERHLDGKRFLKG